MGTVPRTQTILGDKRSNLLDPPTGHYIAIDEVHSNIHRGIVFTTGNSIVDLATDASLDLLLITPPGIPIHVPAASTVGGEAEAFLYENVTTSADGASLACLNRTRPSALETAVTCWGGPTVTGFGTTIYQGFIQGGSEKVSVGGQLDTFAEYILKPSTKYLFRVTNLAVAAKVASIAVHFYDWSLV
jgi:hypothetical protein